MLKRPKFRFENVTISSLLTMLRSKGELHGVSPGQFASPDPADTKFLDCAFAAQADFIVTGNRRHFPSGRYGPTQVVNAGELLARMTSAL